MLQWHAVEKLHSNEKLSIVFANFVDRANVGAAEGGSRAGFATETLHGFCILRYLIWKKLKSYGATERSIFRLVDHAHTPAPEFLEEAVVRYDLIDHGGARKGFRVASF